MTTDIRIRDARREDAEAIGRGVVMALHDEIALDFAGSADRLPLVYKVFTTLAAADNSQYSYRNTLVAETADGAIAGILTAYDGSALHRLRDAFIHEANSTLGTEFVEEEMDDETSDDEIYLDSLAVFPEYRGQNLAKRLINAMAERHSASGKPLGLLCEPGYDHLLKLYGSLGFRETGMRKFAGKEMHHLQRL